MKPFSRSVYNISASLVFIFMLTGTALSLDPSEVLVLANMNASQSKGLAEFYMTQRKIPETNLVLLFMTDKETCSRDEYETKAVPPVRRFLKKNGNIRAIVTLYGLPLRIASPGNTPAEASKLDRLETRKKAFQEKLDNENLTDEHLKKQIKQKISTLNRQIKNHKWELDKVASFDSELMLVKKKEYSINKWLPNPFYLGFAGMKTPLQKDDILMVSRLDGADAKIVKRIITDSIDAEKQGLKGTAYFDARYKDPGDKKIKGSGYTFYDRSVHRAAKKVSDTTDMAVVLEDTSSLFSEGSCPDAALYCGWYSLAKYIDSFSWQKGSVGYHIASSECATLKNPNSRVWCKKMLDNGIAATVGPVGEPYVQAFPVPEIFFTYLSEGILSLAECYLVSLPYVSWKMVLVGDPLYRVNIKK